MICIPHPILFDQIEKNEMDGACSTMGERRGVYRVLVGKPEGKEPHGIPKRRWEDINPYPANVENRVSS